MRGQEELPVKETCRELGLIEASKLRIILVSGIERCLYPAQMLLTVQTLNGTKLKIWLTQDASILDLKAHIKDREGETELSNSVVSKS